MHNKRPDGQNPSGGGGGALRQRCAKNCSIEGRLEAVLAAAIGNACVPIQWQCAASLNWPFSMLKYIFRIKYTEAILPQTALGNSYGLKLAKC